MYSRFVSSLRSGDAPLYLRSAQMGWLDAAWVRLLLPSQISHHPSGHVQSLWYFEQASCFLLGSLFDAEYLLKKLVKAVQLEYVQTRLRLSRRTIIIQVVMPVLDCDIDPFSKSRRWVLEFAGFLMVLCTFCIVHNTNQEWVINGNFFRRSWFGSSYTPKECFFSSSYHPHAFVDLALLRKEGITNVAGPPCRIRTKDLDFKQLSDGGLRANSCNERPN